MKNKKLKKKLKHYKTLFRYNRRTIKAQFDTIVVQMRRISDLQHRNSNLEDDLENAEQLNNELQSINAITKEREDAKEKSNEAPVSEISFSDQVKNLHQLLMNSFELYDNEDVDLFDILHEALYYAKYNKRPDEKKKESICNPTASHLY